MIPSSRVSPLRVHVDNPAKQRERNLLAFFNQFIKKPEPFFFNSTKMLISSLSFRCVFSMWKDIGELPNNQSPFLLRLSLIDEITITSNCAIVRSRNGLCGVYKLLDRSFVGFINQMNHELVKSVFINESGNENKSSDDSKIIKAVCLKEDNFSRVRCFTSSITDMKNSMEIFKDEDISFPGFVEFDSINSRGIVLNGNLTYSIYNLKDFTLEKRISGAHIRDVKFVPGLLIVTQTKNKENNAGSKKGNVNENICVMGNYQRRNGSINDIDLDNTDSDENYQNNYEPIYLEFHSFDGNTCTVELRLVPGKEIQFIDCLGSNIVIKQAGYNARIYDAGTHAFSEIPSTAELKITDFLFLYRARKFFIYHHGQFEVFSFSGEFLFSLTASSSKRSLDPSPAAVSKSQEFLAACSHSSFSQWIYIFSLKDGSLYWTRKIPPQQNNGYKITALAFDEVSCSLIVGDESGRISFYQ
ncbi:hypothetical protein M9Y10_041409 [Tritrichomonas musculus]|uniref:Uncharacterized protein n=1 Tax=Tritrichomonas musculus TaxID=1915356 RepID=A0ABR2K7B8_9EUKA